MDPAFSQQVPEGFQGMGIRLDLDWDELLEAIARKGQWARAFANVLAARFLRQPVPNVLSKPS